VRLIRAEECSDLAPALAGTEPSPSVHWLQRPTSAAPPDEPHTHGAADDGPMIHLTVTTGGYHFPQS
jgi:hypothetical protein